MVEFVRSVYDLKDLPHDGKPEIAFAGRSNVGKSSLINALASRNDIAKVSSTPGKTQSLNFYNFDNDFYLVDMPGYGFARSSIKDRISWGKLIEGYLTSREELKMIAVLVDARHIGLGNDRMVMEWLEAEGLKWIAVLTKADKVVQKDISAHITFIRESFPGCSEVLKTSAKDGKGMREALSFLRKCVKP